MLKKTNEVRAKRSFQWTLLAIAFVVTVFSIGTGSFVQNEATVQVGDVATKIYVALKDAVDEVTTGKLQTAAANSVGPMYKNDVVVEENSTKQVNDVFQELEDILLTTVDGATYFQRVQEASLNLPVVLSNKQVTAYQTMSRGNRLLFAENCVAVVNQVYAQGISADALDKGREQLRVGIAATPWNVELKSMAYTIVAAAIEPNLVLDEDAMEVAREQKRSEVTDVLIRKNQKIVDEGEIITQDVYDRLVSLKLIGGADYQNTLLPLMGSLLIVILIFGAIVIFFIWGQDKRHLRKNEMQMLLTVYVIMILLVRVMSSISYFTLIPLGLFAMLISLLIGRRIGLLMNCFFCIIGCFIWGGDVEFLIYSLVSGSFGALLIQKTVKRSYMVPVAVAMAGVNFAAMFAVGLFFRNGYSMELLVAAGLGALLGAIAVVIALGSLPFWEGVFEANTPLRLLELTNPNNELLRRLMIEAPGTYHHSLIVANLAETAVYEIGGNTALARAGAYYHDIGKLKAPMFFGENQSGTNPHDELEPRASARIITQHTQYGVELGLEHGLPNVILSIVKEHHGNSLVKFFYYKALKAEGAENVSEVDFRYDGQIPTGRESAVVMLADTVEAAVRSMLGKGKTLEETEKFVATLIKDKLDDGQLDQSGLAIHELAMIRKAFLKVFHGMYHERVSYPKKEEIEAAAKNLIEEHTEIAGQEKEGETQ